VNGRQTYALCALERAWQTCAVCGRLSGRGKLLVSRFVGVKVGVANWADLSVMGVRVGVGRYGR